MIMHYIINAASSFAEEKILRVILSRSRSLCLCLSVSVSVIVSDVTEKVYHYFTAIEESCYEWKTNRTSGKDRKGKYKHGSTRLFEQGQIIENYLFSSLFRIVVAVRLSTNETGKIKY